MSSGGSLIISPDAPPLVRSRWAGYVELTRPRLAVMVLFTVAAGFGLASAGAPDLARLLHTVFGTALVVAGATALNQVLERPSDAQMDRTHNRPLPSGRLQPVEVLIFGVIMALAGRWSCVPGPDGSSIPGNTFSRLRVSQLRVPVHTPEAEDDTQHPGGSGPRRDAARDRLDGCRGGC
jgi:hypothetical protein